MSAWVTYAVLINGRQVEAPGATKTIAEVNLLVQAGHAEAKPLRDGGRMVMRWRMRS